MSVMASNLGNVWRRLVAAEPDRQLVVDQPAAAIGQDGWPIKHARYYWLLLAESHLKRRLFGSMVRRIASLPWDLDGGTYVVCVDCGKQFAYDWERMRIGEALDPSSPSEGVWSQKS